jgi:hypothetical protein
MLGKIECWKRFGQVYVERTVSGKHPGRLKTWFKVREARLMWRSSYAYNFSVTGGAKLTHPIPVASTAAKPKYYGCLLQFFEDNIEDLPFRKEAQIKLDGLVGKSMQLLSTGYKGAGYPKSEWWFLDAIELGIEDGVEIGFKKGLLGNWKYFCENQDGRVVDSDGGSS